MKRCIFTLVAACALVAMATVSMAFERLNSNGRVNSFGQSSGGQSCGCGEGVSCSQGVACGDNCSASEGCGCDDGCGKHGRRHKCKNCGCESAAPDYCHSCLHCRRGWCWDGRCDQTSYLPENFRYYGQPVQLGADAFTYWRRPMCAEEKYGYSTPGFNFFTVRGTFDPSTGLGGGEAHCMPQELVLKRPERVQH